MASTLPQSHRYKLAQGLFTEIIDHLETEKLYLNPDLKQNTLIVKLQTNKKYFYEAIVNNSALNFNQLVNFYRLEDVKRTIEEHCQKNNNIRLPQNYFMNSGFNTASSFYRIFKENIGITPLEYAREFIKAQKLVKPKENRISATGEDHR